jgi:tRNA nucleotidyltransferase (CCA-adding enzyme)
MTRDLSLSRIQSSLPHGSQPLVRALGEAARAAGSRLYLVGGPVRDILLERPIRDLDLLVAPGTDAMGIARTAAPEGARLVEYGRFGTLRMETGDLTIDIASARSETYARPGALPTVEPGSLEDDLRRRDFSVNALAIPLDAGSGRTALPIEDPCGGVADLGEMNLRVLHSRSFHDDPTRILRAARLAPRLGFKLPRATRSALRDALRDGALGAVSGDRLRREFEKLFADASLGLDPSLALRNLGQWHVLGALEPGFEWPKVAAAPVRRLGRTIAEPQWRQNRNRPWVSGLALCLAPLRPALRRRVLQRFAVRGEAADRIANFGRERNRLLAALAKARGRGAVDGLLGGIHEETLLALFASAQPLVRGRVLRWAAEDRGRRAPLSGEDLVAMGLEGPSVGKVLARIRVAHLDGAIANREEAAALAVEWIRRRGAKARTRSKK